jgi:hypothetical protein
VNHHDTRPAVGVLGLPLARGDGHLEHPGGLVLEHDAVRAGRGHHRVERFGPQPASWLVSCALHPSGSSRRWDMGAGSPAYHVTKAALNALTRTLAVELRDSAVLVNAVSPGWTATDMGGSGGRPIAEGAASIVWGVPDDGPPPAGSSTTASRSLPLMVPARSGCGHGGRAPRTASKWRPLTSSTWWISRCSSPGHSSVITVGGITQRHPRLKPPFARSLPTTCSVD